MKKIILLLLILVPVIAYFTKPDDKTCIIEGVKAVWGGITPDPSIRPDLFEHFMDLNSPNVSVKDWVLLKQIQYKIGNTQKTVAIGAFQNVFALVKPMETKSYIPPMPRR